MRSQILSLLDKIDKLLENNIKIRNQLVQLLIKEDEPPITDILGIKVYLGKDYIEPKVGERIKIGEEIQDCGGNWITPIDIPKTYTGEDINAEVEILEERYNDSVLDLWR